MELRFSGSIEDLPEARRLELLVDAVVDSAIYLLDVDGKVRTWNAGAERITGYSANQVIGRHFSVFFTPEDRAVDLPGQLLARARLTGQAEHDGLRVRNDGSRFWAFAVMHPVRAPNGRTIGFADVTRDITERRQAQG